MLDIIKICDNQEKPYSFISYSHKDSKRVYPILHQLQISRYRFWFDRHIEGGMKWAEDIYTWLTHDNCKQFIIFISKNSSNSENVQDEVNLARKHNKKCLVVYLEKMELTGGMALQLDRWQAIYWEYITPEVSYKLLVNSILNETIDNNLVLFDDANLLGNPNAYTLDYLELVGFKKVIPQKGIRTLPRIPVGVDSSGDLVSLSFEKNENHLTFLCGSTGSGKSNLLHVIISGLIQNIHPDDIEIWLVDFDKTVFLRYAEVMPPQIKFLILENNPELVFDLLNRLLHIIHGRESYSARNRKRCFEDFPCDKFFPSIFVIIDDFLIMLEIIEASNDKYGYSYRRKLEEILVKSRTYGIHFIFASQSYTACSQKLSDYAMNQIRQRLIMCNSKITEIQAVFNNFSLGEHNVKSEQLHPYGFLRRIRDIYENKIEIIDVLNLADDESHFRTGSQLEYMQWLNQIMHINKNHPPYFDFRDHTCYVDKQPLVINGNLYKSFDEVKEYISYDIAHSDDTYRYKTLVYIGEPMRMCKAKAIEVYDSYWENILIVAPLQNMTSILSIFSTTTESLKIQDVNIECWADKMSIYYQQISNMKFSQNWNYRLDDIDVIEGIRDLANQIKNGHEAQKCTYYFLLISGIVHRMDAQMKELLKYVLNRGPYWGYHFILLVESVTVLRLYDIDPTSFKHKLFYRMPYNDALQILGTEEAMRAEQIPETCCRYTDGMDSCSYRPLLHPGITLNGWYVDVDGIIHHKEDSN